MFMRFSRPKAAARAPLQAAPPVPSAEETLSYYTPDTSAKKLQTLSAIDQMYGYYTAE